MFAGSLFHWRIDDSESSKYSLKPANYPALPLYMFNTNDPILHTSFLNKLEEKEFQMFLLCKMKKWLGEFPLMVPAAGKDAVAVGNMAAFAALCVEKGLAVGGLQGRGQYHFWMNKELHPLNQHLALLQESELN